MKRMGDTRAFSMIDNWHSPEELPPDGELVLASVSSHGADWVDLARHFRGYWQTQFGVAVRCVGWLPLPDPILI